ncbi:winged helix-turn-helix domain-containing protein [Microcoleus sp. AR_TQ3_B6]|uniref:winged helix-turn-helix domain-containing protein n=1 Tax=Microcoleus sp. AR_TQ3_B6 TaxID=3055284 RepID=UPI002FD4F07A
MAELALLWQVLQQPPPDGGLWNGPKVADWMSELKGYKVCRQRGWEYLKSMKFRLRVPRPEHQESDWEHPGFALLSIKPILIR